MLKFSANLGLMWAELDLSDRTAAASRAGFKAVEFQFPYVLPAVDLAGSCEEYSVKLLGINTNIVSGSSGHAGLGAVPGREEGFRDLFLQALDYADSSGATAIHVMAGKVRDEDRRAAENTFISNLKWAVALAASHGLTLYLEPLNTRDMPGYFYSRVEDAARVIEAVGSADLKLMFDAYHVGCEHENVVERFNDLFDIIGHVQIAAVPSRAEPDEGEVDYKAFLNVVEQSGYDGWIGAEYKPRGKTEDGLHWVRTLGFDLSHS